MPPGHRTANNLSAKGTVRLDSICLPRSKLLPSVHIPRGAEMNSGVGNPLLKGVPATWYRRALIPRLYPGIVVKEAGREPA
jgi:hypothetical protein